MPSRKAVVDWIVALFKGAKTVIACESRYGNVIHIYLDTGEEYLLFLECYRDETGKRLLIG